MSEIIAAVISVLISSIVSLIVNLLVRRQGHNEFYSKTVSAERLSWISDMRELFATFFAICEMHKNDDLSVKQRYEFNKIRNSILIRLNPVSSGYELDNQLRQLIETTDFMSIKNNMADIRSIIEQIIKDEWDKIKIEAGRDVTMVKHIHKKNKSVEKVKKEMESKIL